MSGTWKPFFRKLRLRSVLFLLLTAGLLATSTLPAFAQGDPVRVYTLKMAIDQALAQNGMVKTSVLEVQNQKVLRQGAWDFNNTDIGFSYGQKNSARQDNEFIVSQKFSFPTAYASQARLARSYVERAELQSDLTKNEVIAQVKSTYYELSYGCMRLALLRSQDSLYGNFLHAARSRYQKGETSLLEKMTAESQLLSVKNRIGQAEADIRIQGCRLQTLLNEKSEIRIADTTLQRLRFTSGEEPVIKESNPSILMLREELQMAEYERKVAVSKLYPDVTIGYFNQSNREISTSGRFTGVELGLSIPILFPARKGKIESAQLNEKMAAENINFRTNALNHTLHIQLQEYQKYSRNVDYFENQALQQAAAIIDQAEKSYKGGAIDYMEFIQNLRQGLEIRENYLDALNAVNQSVIAMELLMNQLN